MGAVVELIHAATLVHDDVIDAPLRPGPRPSFHQRAVGQSYVRAGRRLAVHAGLPDRAARAQLHVLDLLIGLTQMMVEGELLQLERIGRIDVTEADCMELVDRKTACCLFTVCAKLGALVAGADSQTEEKLGEYAWNLGMAFQLVDDVLDFTAREKTLGKPVGGDLREGKVTLPLVYALERARSRAGVANASWRTATRERTASARYWPDRTVRRHRARARAGAGVHRQSARSDRRVPERSPYQRALYGITDLVTDRTTRAPPVRCRIVRHFSIPPHRLRCRRRRD